MIVLIARSPARRVGDGGEYVAMALNLASFRPPSFSQSDLHRIEKQFDEIGHGYETVPLDLPALRGRDGRQDLPHFWLYPLLAVPPLWAIDAVHVHPNHAFTILNLTIACAAFILLLRTGSVAVATLLLAGPLVWWIDKAHGDVFTVSLLSIAFALLHISPNVSLIALGAAAAQNPPLAPVFGLTLLYLAIRQGWRNLRSVVYGAVVGTLLTAAPVFYYEYRLGVATPIVAWTHYHVPTMRELGAFVWDPNIGLVVNNPIFAIVLTAAFARAIRGRRIGILESALPIACALVLLGEFTQSVNINHGATPGMNRWTLWLMPLAMPWLIDAARDKRGRRALTAAAAASVAWAVIWFQPARAESYKTPTQMARWVWTQAPRLDNPPAEIFAERVSGAEPAPLPIATATCGKVLAVDGLWPVPCLPPLDPPVECTTAGTACYANESRIGYGFASTRFPAGFDFSRARAWPLEAGFARHLRAALDELGIDGLTPSAAGQSGAMLRAAHGVAWTYTLQAADRLFVYVPAATDNAVLTMRLPGPMAGSFIDLSSGERVTSVVRGGTAWSVWDVKVPAARRHLALVMRTVAPVVGRQSPVGAPVGSH